MRSLQDIRIDVVRMGKEVKVSQVFEERFRELNDYLMQKFGCPEFKLEDFEIDKIDNTKFESTILKFAICKAFGIPVYSGPNNPWFDCFSITRVEDLVGYHGSMSNLITVKYDLVMNEIIKYEIYNLITISDEQIDFLKNFKEKYKVLKEKIETIKSDFFPIMVSE